MKKSNQSQIVKKLFENCHTCNQANEKRWRNLKQTNHIILGKENCCYSRKEIDIKIGKVPHSLFTQNVYHKIGLGSISNSHKEELVAGDLITGLKCKNHDKGKQFHIQTAAVAARACYIMHDSWVTIEWNITKVCIYVCKVYIFVWRLKSLRFIDIRKILYFSSFTKFSLSKLPCVYGRSWKCQEGFAYSQSDMSDIRVIMSNSIYKNILQLLTIIHYNRSGYITKMNLSL